MALDRRTFLAVGGGLLGSLRVRESALVAQSVPLYAYVGSFTNVDGRARDGVGISVFRVDTNSGHWIEIQRLTDVANPNWVTVDRSQRWLYTAHGRNRELASAFAINPRTGELRRLNTQPTGRDGGLHIAVDPSNRFVLVPHNPGGVAVLPIQTDGSLGPMTHLADWTGVLGPHREEQTTPHPHQICFDRRGRFIIIPDKGLDLVHVFRLDAQSGKLVANVPPSVKARSGAAPRHAVVHPTERFVYVVNELDSTVTAYRFDPDLGNLEPFQVIPTIPTSFTGNNTGAEIVMSQSGWFLYVSNRGHNSVVVFRVDSSGTLSHVTWTSTEGQTPRFIGLDPTERRLHVANQASNTVVSFEVDSVDGVLRKIGEPVQVGSPTCIGYATPLSG